MLIDTGARMLIGEGGEIGLGASFDFDRDKRWSLHRLKRLETVPRVLQRQIEKERNTNAGVVRDNCGLCLR